MPSTSGQVEGAGIDVFAVEPTTESPLFELPSVVVTPHLGASTVEAQDKAGVTIGEMVVLALAGDFVPFAVNVAATEVPEAVRPFMPLAEQLGRIFACLNDGLPDKLEVEYQGGLASVVTSILTLSMLKGLFAAGTEEPVSYVNAPQLAEERGLQVREASTTKSQDYINLITLQKRRPRCRRNPHGSEGGTAPRDGRRPRGGGSSFVAHARRAKRRSGGDDRCRRDRARRCRCQHLVDDSRSFCDREHGTDGSFDRSAGARRDVRAPAGRLTGSSTSTA